MDREDMDGAAKVSIIVAVLNGGGVIRRCLESIRLQTYSSRELLVKDGDSTDDTAEVLKEFSNEISWIESAPDNGIYDAWNKALAHATGDWVCFLGADDYFADRASISVLMAETVGREIDLVCAQVALMNGERTIRLKGEPWSWDRMKHHQIVAHPGMLQRRSLFHKYGKFDPSLKIAGDYDFLLRLGAEARARFLERAVVRMDATGLSNTRIGAALWETCQVQSAHGEIGAIRATYNYLIALVKVLLRKIVCAL